MDVTPEEFDRVFNVNVRSIFLSARAIVPQMKKQGGGSIINVSSTGSIRPRPGLVWYNSSKGAVTNVPCLPNPFLFIRANIFRQHWVLRPSMVQTRSVSMPLHLFCLVQDCSRHSWACQIHQKTERSSFPTCPWDESAMSKMLLMRRCSLVAMRASSSLASICKLMVVRL